ncbi:MAG: hypothetical protein R3E39_17210 [Anaerolineae bacterium]
MPSKYIGPIKRLGTAAIIAFVIAVLFPVISNALLSEEARKSVLIHAIPFFAAFVGILLLFILVIFLVALRYNGKVPGRCYSGIEYTIIAGILGGVICLFQPFSFVPYHYGFILVLVSLLSFILWSHVVPATARQTADLPALGSRQHLIGGVAGLVVAAIIASSYITSAAPQEPYGVRERVWNSYDDERKASIAAEATSTFASVEVPFLIIFSLFPAAIIYFAVREAVAERRPDEQTIPQGVTAASSG